MAACQNLRLKSIDASNQSGRNRDGGAVSYSKNERAYPYLTQLKKIKLHNHQTIDSGGFEANLGRPKRKYNRTILPELNQS